jgi:menaquinone-dependent protoporphyrinogen oxidase
MGRWLDDALAFLAQNQDMLKRHPVWLFSSGPLPGGAAERPGADALERALGPLDGPGSGGRKRVESLAAVIGPRSHAVFDGAFNPADPPAALSERIVRWLPAAKLALPAGDFRDWEAIEAWAGEIAAALATEPVAVG